TSCAADRGVREEPTRAHGSARGGITGTIKLPDRPLRMAVVPLGGRTTRHVLAVTYVSGGSCFTLAFYDLRTLRKVSPSVGSDVYDSAAADRYVWLKQTSPLDMSARLVRIRATDVVVASDNTSIGNVFPLSTYLPRHIGLPPDTEILSATREA